MERRADVRHAESMKPSPPDMAAALTCRSVAPMNIGNIRSAPVTGTAFGSGVRFEPHVDLMMERRSAVLQRQALVPLPPPTSLADAVTSAHRQTRSQRLLGKLLRTIEQDARAAGRTRTIRLGTDVALNLRPEDARPLPHHQRRERELRRPASPVTIPILRPFGWPLSLSTHQGWRLRQ